ncbi:hypothetical protein [Nocardioides sp. GY 10127]|uniref:hypothetical protein n=1 Tax=Nocardioides sp. GY 10127 TaxID=2569762 RepID=UPI0010A7BCAE|nr:hypothetical protein [Nocardioides sp. GY 10127]TIC82749.1 hypothetical protein E8D37_08660 [Nocardioides sp. GY 10127]
MNEDLNPLLPHSLELVLLVLVLVPLLLWVATLVDVLGRPRQQWVDAGQNRVVALLVVVLLGLIGVALYWFLVRPSLVRAQREATQRDATRPDATQPDAGLSRG